MPDAHDAHITNGTHATLPANTASPRLTPEFLARERERMAAQPVPLERPLVVLSGWRAFRLAADATAAAMAQLTSGRREDVLGISFADLSSTDPMIRRVLDRVVERFPPGDPQATTEVDVIGVSMGGLLARAAAMPSATRRYGRRLRIRRLFTLASPHRGARLARYICADSAARDLAPGSEFIRRLDEALAVADYEMVCYARLSDWWVGATNTAPPPPHPASVPIWFPSVGFGNHVFITLERRIILDIARRLRGEEPLARPTTPPPHD